MNIAVYATPFRTLKIAGRVADFLRTMYASGHRFMMASSTVDAFLDYGINILEHVEASTLEVIQSDANCDFVFSLGGDGTFLRAAHWVHDCEIPVVGINLGHLGYLTAFRIDEMERVPQLLAQGDFDVEQRAMLEVSLDKAVIECNGEPWFTALNEVAILKQDTASMISIPVRLDEKDLGVYSSDGLIVATPTGSTAYNLSVGGPVLQPTVGALVLSPIADHSLTMRPMVIGDKAQLEVTAVGRTSSFRVSLDGNSFVVPTGTKINIKKARFRCLMVCKKGLLFASTLRSKLLWGEQPVGIEKA